jgi:hypothetical protein
MLDREFAVAQFHEVQYFHQRWRLAILAGLVTVFLYGCFQQVVRGQPWGNRPVSSALLVVMTLALAALIYWLLKMHLVTEVRERELYVHFMLFWKPRRFPFSAILSVEPVTYRPIEQYGGRGIRRGRHGWAYTVSGDRGVKLVLAGGEQFLVGSQRPEDLAAAIRRRLQE